MDESPKISQDPPLRQGWVFSKRTCVFRGIQVTRHFIEFVVVETKQIVGTNSNVILTRQTCGQRSGMAAVSKHRAIAFYFSVRIYYMFLMSKCRGKSDLGLCMTSVLAKRMPMTGPASLAEQIGPEHRDGCSLLLLVPLSQLDTTSPLVHTPPRSRPLSLHGHSTWARITACGRWRWLVPSLSLHGQSTWARRPAGPLPHARTGRHTAGLSHVNGWQGSLKWSIPIYSKPQ